jgi:hypothetical protein
MFHWDLGGVLYGIIFSSKDITCQDSDCPPIRIDTKVVQLGKKA